MDKNKIYLSVQKNSATSTTVLLEIGANLKRMSNIFLCSVSSTVYRQPAQMASRVEQHSARMLHHTQNMVWHTVTSPENAAVHNNYRQ
jgi:hypothetical protein